MQTYRRVTIEPVERGGLTPWRVLGWINDLEWVTLAYCPSKEVADVIKQALTEMSMKRKARR
jgi:hypothetical protein